MIKVVKLASDVIKLTDYRHSEEVIADTIIRMGENFLWTKNVNLLDPVGNFGTSLKVSIVNKVLFFL